MPDLKTNYVESVFEDAVQKFYMTDNGDGTVSFSDIGDSQYIVKGDYITATDINITNDAVNDLAVRYMDWIGPFTPLDTNYVNDEFTVKKFGMTSLGNNEYSFTDQTVYTQRGTVYNAAKINATNSLLMTLQINYDSGVAEILDYLHRQGATSNDLLTALAEMENYQQNTIGMEQGINEVKANPHSYNVYTQTEYTNLTLQNAHMRSRMQNVKSLIDSYRTNLNNNNSLFIRSINSAKSIVNAIVGGMSKAVAEDTANSAIRSGKETRSLEDSAVTEYRNKCADYISMLE